MPLGIDFMQVLLHAFNVVLLFGGLYILLYSPVKKFMAKREAYYADLENQANAKLAEANAFKEEYETKLKNVQEEIAAGKKKASLEIEESKKMRMAEAAEEAEKIVARAKADADKQRSAIISDAKIEISEMIGEAAKKLLLESDEKSLYDAFLTGAERSANAGKQS